MLEILQSLWKWFTQMNPPKDGVALFGLKVLPIAMLLILAPAQIFAQVHETSLEFPGGYPTAGTAQRFYDEADLNRAIEAYRFFYPNVSMLGMLRGMEEVGAKENRSFLIFEARPSGVLFTPNSDTPYAAIPLDLKGGPMIVELPPGQLLGMANDLNFRRVIDISLPNPDARKGGKHLILPPDWKGKIPAGYSSGQSTTYRVFLIIRSLPIGGDLKKAKQRLQAVKIRPLSSMPGWTAPKWTDVSEKNFDATPLQWENDLRFWQALHSIIDSEPAFQGYRHFYGELGVLGIVKGQPFAPDDRMKGILEQAAKAANGQMRVQSLYDRRPDRIVWQDRKSWEWVSLRRDNGTFEAATYTDLDAREKWFWQAAFESPTIFRSQSSGGLLYWFAARDNAAVFLDGNKTYKLTVPQPVPTKLFWSITVYDAETRSEIHTNQNMAALRSLFELKDKTSAKHVDLYFGSTAPVGKEAQWIKTIPGKGWFAYFRIYDPEQPAFDGRWKLGDFEEVREVN